MMSDPAELVGSVPPKARQRSPRGNCGQRLDCLGHVDHVTAKAVEPRHYEHVVGLDLVEKPDKLRTLPPGDAPRDCFVDDPVRRYTTPADSISPSWFSTGWPQWKRGRMQSVNITGVCRKSVSRATSC